jgi:hypothetical protein
VESEPITERDDVEMSGEDFCKDFTKSLEMKCNNGLPREITECDTIYTADIMAYYDESPNEVEEALYECYGGLGDFNTISDAISAGVALALERIADAEILKVIETFKTSAKDTMMDHILSA